MLGTSSIQARYNEHSIYNPANRAEKDTKEKMWPFSLNRREKKSTNTQIIARNIFKLRGGKIKNWPRLNFFLCKLLYWSQSLWEIPGGNSEIIGETNSQLRSNCKLWKKHVSRYMVMLSYIWYFNQLFYGLPLALTHLSTLLGFGRWLTYNNRDLESVILITLRSSFVLLGPMGLLRMKSEYAENAEY